MLRKIAVALLLFSPALTAQTSKPPLKPYRTRVTVPAKLKLTPQQRVGLRILDQQANVAKGLSPVTRTFAFLEVARGYEKLQRPKALAGVRNAFQASLSIQADEDKDRTMESLQ